MPAVLARLRAEGRSRWAAWLAVAVIAGLGGGAVIGLVAGARRTERAYPHLLGSSNSSDVLVAGKNSFGLVGSVDLDDVEKLPQVAESTRVTVTLLFAGQTNSGRRIGPVDVFPLAPHDTRLGTTIEKWKMLDGRRADPTKVDEATASFVLAQQLDLHVGDTVRLHFVKAESFGAVAAQLLSQFGSRLAGVPGSEATRIDRLADGPDITFHVVGIEAAPDEVPPRRPAPPSPPPGPGGPPRRPPAAPARRPPATPPHPRVLRAVRLADRGQPAHVRSAPPPLGPARVRTGGRAPRARATGRLHHQPRHAHAARPALGRRGRQRAAPARAAHVARAGVRPRSDTAPAGAVRGARRRDAACHRDDPAGARRRARAPRGADRPRRRDRRGRRRSPGVAT